MKCRILNYTGPVTRLYKQYSLDNILRRDLNLVLFSVTFGMAFASIANGPALTGFAQVLGANDFFYGVMKALPVLGGTMQLFASWLIEKTCVRKKWYVIFGIIQRILWMVIAAAPWFIPMNPSMLRLWAVIMLVTLSAISAAFVNVSFFSWMSELIPNNIRGRFLAIRSSVSTIAGIFGALIAGWVLDNISGMIGYSIVFSFASICGIIDIIIFLRINEPPMVVRQHESFIAISRKALSNRPFLWYLVFWTVWHFCWFLTVPYNNVYALGVLNLSFQKVTFAGQVTSGIITIIALPLWGRWLDSRSTKWVLKRGLIIMAGMPLIWIFARPGIVWPVLFFNLGYSAANSGIALTAHQMLMGRTPAVNRSLYIAFYAVTTSLFGTVLGYLAGGAFLECMGNISFSLLGLGLDRYKLLFLSGGLLQTTSCLFLLGRMYLKREQGDYDN